MKPIQKMIFQLSSVSVYKGVLDEPVPKALLELLTATIYAHDRPIAFYRAWGDFFSALCEQGGEDSLAGCISRAVLYDDNCYTRACAAGQAVSDTLLAAVQQDLSALLEAAYVTPKQVWGASKLSGVDLPYDVLPEWNTGTLSTMFRRGAAQSLALLPTYYRHHGCGMYARYRAFTWRGRAIKPVPFPDPIRLTDLKGYEGPRELVLQNTRAFLQNAPANNCLLYGDRGTGKSSTVKAILNEYATYGLRVIEMPKEHLLEFPDLVAQIANLPMKFLIFIDDLSFSRQDDTYAALKAVLEGGVAVRPANTLIYATSNRRHLLRETFSDREGDEIHKGDTIQESLSLADRFGLSVNFSQPGQEEFLEIVRQMARQRGLDAQIPELEAGAKQWALQRGGRSPRCARQYLDDYEASLRATSAQVAPE